MCPKMRMTSAEMETITVNIVIYRGITELQSSSLIQRFVIAEIIR